MSDDFTLHEFCAGCVNAYDWCYLPPLLSSYVMYVRKMGECPARRLPQPPPQPDVSLTEFVFDWFNERYPDEVKEAMDAWEVLR